MDKTIILNIFAQLIGFIGTAFLFISYQQKVRKNILVFQTISSLFFMTHFFILGVFINSGAFTGCFMNVLGALRAFVYSQNEKKWARSPLWVVFFLIAFSVAGILTADTESFWWLFPTMAMVLSTVTLWLQNPRLVRILTFPASPMWLTYNIVVRSYSGMVTETFVIISLLISIIRYDILRKDQVAT